jgi:predicted 2-oxoglutarate/Fe(II)-dependent dioxygenase YbiX
MPQLEHHFLEGTGPRCFLPFLVGDEIGFLRDAVRGGFPASHQEKIECWLAEALAAVEKYYGYDVGQGIKDLACERWEAPQRAMPARRDWERDDEAGRRKLTFLIQASDSNEYVGGDLLIYANFGSPLYAPRAIGTLVVFPSFMSFKTTPLADGAKCIVTARAYGNERLR